MDALFPPKQLKGKSIVFECEIKQIFTRESFDQFCLWAYENKASDMFLTSDYPLQVKIDGRIQQVSKQVLTTKVLALLLKDIYLPSAPTDISAGTPESFIYTVLDEKAGDLVTRYRCEATGCDDAMSDKGLSLVVRTIPALPPSVETLGVEQEIQDMMENKFGLVLITGPTGSGKTTLIGSLIRKYAVEKAKVVISYEHPIEFNLSGLAITHHTSLN